jgi:nitrite reductase/ring-hydroxylating ferredoxin subunit/putative sterol carrier protein
MQQRTSRTIARARGDEPRFPFPSLPKGWFVVAMSEDVPPGEIVPLHYFGRDLVAFRGESGKVHVVDAYCPHLGASFAHGGTIEHDCVRCPFHGWRFDGEGRCVEVPYSDRVPPKAKIDAWPVLEQDGCIYMFYSPEPLAAGEPWPLPAIDLDGWMPGKVIVWRELRTHPQEIFENTVDIAHIGPVHDGRNAGVVVEPIRDGEVFTIELEFEAPGDVVDMPGTFNDVHLHVTMRGLGHTVVRTHVRNVDIRAMQRIYTTPIDETTLDMRGVVHVKPTDDPQFSEELAEIFYRAYVEDFARDFPIWENKRYLVRPSLAKGDGPIGVYRRWCAQFYVGGEGKETGAARSDEGPSVDVPLAGGSSLLKMVQPVRERVVETLSQGASHAAQLLAQTRARVPWLSGPAPASGPRSDAADASAGSSSRSAAKSEARQAKPEPSLPVASVQEYVDTLPQRFVPSAAAGVDAVFQWQLEGEGGRTFHAHVREGELEIVEGAHPKPTTTLVIGAADYLRVVNGELDGMRVFASGKGKVLGSIKAAMKMRALFPA